MTEIPMSSLSTLYTGRISLSLLANLDREIYRGGMIRMFQVDRRVLSYTVSVDPGSVRAYAI